MKKCIIFLCISFVSMFNAKWFWFIAAPEDPEILKILSLQFVPGFDKDTVDGLFGKLKNSEVAFEALWLPYALDPAKGEHGDGVSIEMVFDNDNLEKAKLGFYILQRPDDDGNPVRHFLGFLASSDIGIMDALGSSLFPRYQNLVAKLQMKYNGIYDPSLFAIQGRVEYLKAPFGKYLNSRLLTRAFVGSAQRMLDEVKAVSEIAAQEKSEPSTPPTTDSPRSSEDSSTIISL